VYFDRGEKVIIVNNFNHFKQILSELKGVKEIYVLSEPTPLFLRSKKGVYRYVISPLSIILKEKVELCEEESYLELMNFEWIKVFRVNPKPSSLVKDLECSEKRVERIIPAKDYIYIYKVIMNRFINENLCLRKIERRGKVLAFSDSSIVLLEAENKIYSNIVGNSLFEFEQFLTMIDHKHL
jgi:hypothetical protein